MAFPLLFFAASAKIHPCSTRGERWGSEDPRMQFVVLAAAVLLSLITALASTTLVLGAILRLMSKLR